MLERRRGNPSLALLTALADALSVDVDRLLH
jgi:transcriptional regulator with XRE-family HTH domain